METVLFINLLEYVTLNPESVWVAAITTVLIVLLLLVLVTTLLVKLLDNSFTLIRLSARKKKEEEFDKSIRCAVDITESLRAIKHDNFADRVSVIQTHNGDHSITGIDFFKFSITHQTTEHNIYPTIADFDKGKPIGLVLSIIDRLKLKKEPHIAYPSTNACNDSSYCRSFYQSYVIPYGAKSLYIFPLTDVKGYMFGFGMVEYVNQPYTMEDRRIKECEDRFIQIGALLSGTEIE